MLKRDIVILSVVGVQMLGAGTYWSVATRRQAALSAAKEVRFTASQVVQEDRRFRGAANAPYTLVEFGDYQCPPCAKAHAKVLSLLSDYPNKLRFQFRNLPLEMHPLARSAAWFAEATSNDTDFWRTHDTLYDNQDDLENILSKNKSAASNKKARQFVQKDVATASTMGLDGTPTFLLCTPDKKVLLLNSVYQADQYLK